MAAALLCLSNAKEGGLSGWSSSISVHNEIVRRRPDLARLLAGPWFMDRKGEVPAGKQGYFELPVFNYFKVGPKHSHHLLAAQQHLQAQSPASSTTRMPRMSSACHSL